MAEIIEVRLPETSEDVTESLVVFWHRQAGDLVEQGEVLVEVQTEKAVFEVEAPVNGRLDKIQVKRGEVAAVGDVLALIEPIEATNSAESENIAGSNNTTGTKGTEQTENPVQSESRMNTVDPSEQVGDGSQIGTAPVKTSNQGFLQASPRVRKLARELGVDLSAAVGTGPGGRLTEEDVRNFAQQSAVQSNAVQQTAVHMSDNPQTVPGSLDNQTGKSTDESHFTMWTVDVTPVRRTIAKRMTQSLHQSAQLTLTAWADVTILSEQRKQLAPYVSWNTWILRAVVMALREHPNLNAVWEETRIHRFEHVHLGVATDTEDGLLVPSIQHAERLNLFDLHEAVLQVVQNARERKLSSGELSGSTFTVTNLGGYGIQFFTPILNPPEAAILGVGQIEPHVEFSGRNLVQRERLPLSLTFDHRIIDGAPAAKFLQTVGRWLATPEGLL